MKTWISEEAGPAASIDALMAVAAYFNLDKEAAVEILAIDGDSYRFKEAQEHAAAKATLRNARKQKRAR